MHLDRLVLGAVLDKDAINYKAFRERFKNLSIGFSIFESLVIKSNEPSGDGKASEFYFDLADHEPIIGAQNQFVLDDDQSEDEL